MISNYEQKYLDRITHLIGTYSNEDERMEIKNFFLNMLDNVDLDSEERPIIVMTVPSETGTSWWRLLTPLMSLWRSYKEEFLFIYLEGELNDINILSYADIWIQHRAGVWHSSVLMLSKEWAKTEKVTTIIHEVDDNEFDLPEEHPMYKMWIEAKKHEMSKLQLKHSDYITTTTKHLKQAFSEFNSAHKIKVIPNSIDFDLTVWNQDFVKPDKYKDKTVIGWAGLAHPEDLAYIARIYEGIYAKYGDKVYFVIAGVDKYQPNDKVTYEQSYEGVVRSYFQKLIDANVIDILDASTKAEYMKYYQMFDINVAFIVGRKWNSYKSNIKALEAGAFGKVTTMSDFGAYNDFANELPILLKYKSKLICPKNVSESWLSNISYWIDNPEEREKVGQQIKDYVRKEYHMQKANNMRYKLFKDILKK